MSFVVLRARRVAFFDGGVPAAGAHARAMSPGMLNPMRFPPFEKGGQGGLAPPADVAPGARA